MPSKPDDKIKFQHILLATDFGEDSLAALPYAISLAEENQSQLLLLHVVEHPAAGIVDLEAVTESMMRRLKELAPPEAAPSWHVEFLVEFGQQFAPPEEQILEIARDRGGRFDCTRCAPHAWSSEYAPGQHCRAAHCGACNLSYTYGSRLN